MDPLSLIQRAAFWVAAACVALGLAPRDADAAGTVPGQQVSGWGVGPHGGFYGYGTTKPAACQNLIDNLNAGAVNTTPQCGPYAIPDPGFQVHPTGVDTCAYKASLGRTDCVYGRYTPGYTAATVTACPANSTASGNACACNTGYEPDAAGTACVPDACTAKLGQAAGEWTYPSASPGGDYYVCNTDACTIKVQGIGFCYKSNPTDAIYQCIGNGTFTGGSCNPQSPGDGSGPGSASNGTPGTPPTPGDANGPGTGPQPCPSGQQPGQINGVTVCQPVGTDSPTSRVQKDVQQTTNPDGSVAKVETTTTTTCTNGTCTTTKQITTTNTPAGGGTPTSSTTTTTNTGSKSGMCQTSPSLPECGNGPQSAFGGSCGAFTCQGDAVHCAIARDQHQRHCQLFDQPNPLSEVGVPAMNGQAQPAGHPGASGESTSLQFSTVIDQTDRLSSGCPGDIVIAAPLAGAITIPISTACDDLAMLGQLLVGISMLAALAIVFR